MYGNLNQDW